MSTAGLFILVWAIIEGGSEDWLSAPVLSGWRSGSLYWRHLQSGRRAPITHARLELFRDARFSSAALSLSLVFFAMFGCMFFLTQYLQMVLGYDALQAGQRLLPIITMAVGAPSR